MDKLNEILNIIIKILVIVCLSYGLYFHYNSTKVKSDNAMYLLNMLKNQ